MPNETVTKSLLRAILDAIDEGILVVDQSNSISHYNMRFVQMWRIPQHIINKRNDKETLAFVMDQLLFPEQFSSKVSRLYGSEEEARDQIQFKDGRTFARYTCPLVLDNGQQGRLWTFRDITRQIKSEADLSRYRSNLEDLIVERTHELAKARDAAIAADKAKSDFLASVSHELRTPLNSIGGFSEMLTEGMSGPVNAKQKTQLSMISKSSKQLLELIDNILDLEKIEAGKMEINPQTFRINPFLQDLQQMFEPQLSAKGLKYYAAAGDDYSIYADKKMLRQILINLLGNAIKFTMSGSIKLECRSNPKGVVLSVGDTGVGMDAKLLKVVFNKFERGKQTLQTQGSGLGLAISKHYAELMGGTLTAESTVGEGSVFKLFFPHKETLSPNSTLQPSTELV